MARDIIEIEDRWGSFQVSRSRDKAALDRRDFANDEVLARRGAEAKGGIDAFLDDVQVSVRR